MLFGRTEFLFGLGEFQRMEQEGAGFLRFDDGIDEAACGCDIRVGELLGIFFHFFLAHSLLVFGRHDFLAEDDVGCALGTHDGDFGARPSEDEIST